MSRTELRRYHDILLIGIGGSNLGIKAIRHALKPEDDAAPGTPMSTIPRLHFVEVVHNRFQPILPQDGLAGTGKGRWQAMDQYTSGRGRKNRLALGGEEAALLQDFKDRGTGGLGADSGSVFQLCLQDRHLD